MAKVVNITVPEDLFEAVDRQAKLEERSRSALIREAVKVYLAFKQRESKQRSQTALSVQEEIAQRYPWLPTQEEIDRPLEQYEAFVQGAIPRRKRPGRTRAAGAKN